LFGPARASTAALTAVPGEAKPGSCDPKAIVIYSVNARTKAVTARALAIPNKNESEISFI
jgi:hypothetical protein